MTTTTALAESSSLSLKSLFCIRTITCFVRLGQLHQPTTSDDDNALDGTWKTTLSRAVELLRRVENCLTTEHGYTVQTIRIATNPFGEWLVDDENDDKATTITRRLQAFDEFLVQHSIEFCSLGPALTPHHVRTICPLIVQTSPRFSCSAVLEDADSIMAAACAEAVQTIASSLTTLPDGLGNFRFAVAACCQPYIPFFPVAKCCSGQQSRNNELAFAIGLENGALAAHFLSRCTCLSDISTIFSQGMRQVLLPIQTICESFNTTVTVDDKGTEEDMPVVAITFQGIDTSLNPSLEPTGSVARALELLPEVTSFGGPGTLAAASCITKALQSIPDIQCTGYCGLMLPLCEDVRLAELSAQSTTTTSTNGSSSPCLTIPNLLSISSVCGVGVDTVPVPGDCSLDDLRGLYLDVAGLAHRWKKSLSCRVFPVPGKQVGEWTTFDFPHMINAKVMKISNRPTLES